MMTYANPERPLDPPEADESVQDILDEQARDEFGATGNGDDAKRFHKWLMDKIEDCPFDVQDIVLQVIYQRDIGESIDHWRELYVTERQWDWIDRRDAGAK